MKKLINPRGYLSWTQVSMWLQSPDRYVRQYIHGAAGYKNDRMDFGSKAATALETKEETDDEMINMLVQLMPRYDVADKEMRANFASKYGVICLLGKPDTFHSENLAFREYKTGTTKWTQKMAQRHKQLLHYAAIIYLKYGKVPPAVHLDHAKTEMVIRDNDYGVPVAYVQLTGEITSFEVKVTLSNILEYLALVTKVAKEIDEVYRAEMEKLV